MGKKKIYIPRVGRGSKCWVTDLEQSSENSVGHWCVFSKA